MRAKRSVTPQLILKEILLIPGGEWAPEFPGWSFIRVSRGTGYWMNPPSNFDLGPGAVLVLSESAQGRIRCSQLCEMGLHYFCVEPKKVSGALTLSEQNVLYEISRREEYTARLFLAHKPLAQHFGSI